MDLRTCRRNGPGLAECESEAAWCRLGVPSGTSVPGHARTGLERGRILATIWIPGANPFNVVRGARGKVAGYGAWPRGTHEVGRGDAMTAVILNPY